MATPGNGTSPSSGELFKMMAGVNMTPVPYRGAESAHGSIAVEAFRRSGLEYPCATVFASAPEVRLSLLATGLFVTIVSTSALKLSEQARQILRYCP